MPLLGFGTWQITGPTAQEATETALAAGYRHLDTAMSTATSGRSAPASPRAGSPVTRSS